MSRRSVFLFVFVALAALLAALWLRRRHERAPDEAKTPESASTRPSPAGTNAGTLSTTPASTPLSRSGPEEVPLHGLRLLTEETARSRGWVPRSMDAEVEEGKRVAAKLSKDEVQVLAEPIAGVTGSQSGLLRAARVAGAAQISHGRTGRHPPRAA